MVKLTCKFPTVQNVSLIVLKHYLLEFNWYRAITQCTHPVNVLTTKLWIKIVRKRIPTRSVAFPAPQIRSTILALYKLVCMYVCIGMYSYSCGQTAACIKMPLGIEVGLSPVDCVRWGPSPLNFRPMFIIVIVISLEHCTGVRRYWFIQVQVQVQYSMHATASIAELGVANQSRFRQ